MSIIPLEEVKDSLIPDLCALIVEYCEPVLVSSSRAEWTRQYLARPSPSMKKTDYHPDDPFDQKVCKCHFKLYPSKQSWKCGTHRERQLWAAKDVVSNPLDTTGLWRDMLLGKHTCHFCTRLFDCNQQHPFWDCRCYYNRRGRWYCISCQPNDFICNESKYNPHYGISREHELEQLRLFHRSLKKRKRS